MLNKGHQVKFKTRRETLTPNCDDEHCIRKHGDGG